MEELKAQLSSAKAELKELEVLREEEAVKELMAAMAEKGVSVSDVIALIKGTAGEV